MLRALKLLYSDDQNKGWTEEEIRSVCRKQLKVFEDEKVQIGIHLARELRLGNSRFEDNKYTHIFPLEDIVDFHSVEEVWNSQVMKNRLPSSSDTTSPGPRAPIFSVVNGVKNESASVPGDLFDDLLPLNRRKIFDDDASADKLAQLTPIAVLMIDLDFFKKINDTFGHPVGDRVLVACAKVLESAIERKGKAYRYGGEELAAILPNFTISEAVATAERIRAQISKLKVDGCSRQITASIGVAVFPDSSIKVEELVASADKALYLAKEEGRNRVKIAGDAKMPEKSVATAAISLSREDRISLVDLELRIDQGVRQTFMASVSNKSDEEVVIKKIKVTCRNVMVVEHEPPEIKQIAPRKVGAFTWTCNEDPCNKTRQIAGIWDRDFEVLLEVELSALVLGSLKVCRHAIKVKVEPNSYRIWQLP